jgi:hypothetical protein
LLAAVKRLLQQMHYEMHFTAISHYYANTLKKKITKKAMKEQNIELSKEQYLAVSNLSSLRVFQMLWFFVA